MASDAASQLYELYFNPATCHAAASWSVFGKEFGLRCFSTKEAAVEAAEEFFGVALFSLRLWPNRTALQVIAAPGAKPASILDQAISALRKERADLENCPVHQATNTKELRNTTADEITRLRTELAEAKAENERLRTALVGVCSTAVLTVDPVHKAAKIFSVAKPETDNAKR